MVVKILVDDHVHHPERQRHIGSGIDGNVPVGTLRRPRAVWIDYHQLAARAPRLFDERPQVNVVAVDVGAPRDDQLGKAELLGLGAHLDSVHRLDPEPARGRTDVALQLRGAQPVKETAVHGAVIQRAERAAIRIRKDRFAAELSRDLTKTIRDLIEGFVPCDPLKVGEIATTAAFGNSLSAAHGIQHTTRRVDAVQILRYLGAQKPARDRMFRVALYLCCTTVLDRDQHSAGIGTIVRTGGMHH